MKPVIATYLGLHLYVYGFGVALTILTVLFLFWRELKRSALQEEKIIDILFASSSIGLVVGRLVYVFLHLPQFQDSFIKAVLLFVYPGVSEGAFVIGFLGSLWVYSHKNKIDYAGLIKILLVPLLVGRILLLIFSFITSFALFYIIGLVIMIVMLGIAFLLLKAAKQNKVLPTSFLYCFIGAEALYLFIIDFFKSGTVYFLGFKLLSIEQTGALIALVWVGAWATINFISSHRQSK